MKVRFFQRKLNDFVSLFGNLNEQMKVRKEIDKVFKRMNDIGR